MGRTVTIRTGPGHRSAAFTARKALREVNKLKRGIEQKFLDKTDSSGTTTAWALLGSDFLVIPQGSGVGTRDGQKVTLKSVDLRGTVTPSVTSQVGHLVRVVMYFVNDNVLPTLPIPMASASVNSFVDIPEKRGKTLRILFDRSFSVPDTFDGTAGTGGDKIFSFHKHIKINKQLEYGDSSSLNPVNGLLAILIISASATTVPVVATNVRVNYTDA